MHSACSNSGCTAVFAPLIEQSSSFLFAVNVAVMYTSLILRYHLVLRLNARIGSVQEGHFRGAFEKKKLKVQNTKTCQLCWSFTLPNADSIGRRYRAHKLAGVKVSFPLSCNVVEECKRAVARSESITLPHMRGTKRELQQSVWVHTKQCHLKYETFSHN